jgi:hypothetical protein
MRMLVYCTSFFLIAGTAFLLMSIAHIEHTFTESNPYELIISAPESSDVFSSVPISVLLGAKIKSGIAIIRTDGNRLWNTEDTVVFLKRTDCFQFICSFKDSGVKNVECLIVDSKGKLISSKAQIVVTFPLKPFLRAVGTDSLMMITPGVKDSVNYVWEFDNGLLVCANNSSVDLPPLECGTYSGKLYVECARNRSPEVKFNFDIDSTGLKNRF